MDGRNLSSVGATISSSAHIWKEMERPEALETEPPWGPEDTYLSWRTLARPTKNSHSGHWQDSNPWRVFPKQQTDIHGWARPPLGWQQQAAETKTKVPMYPCPAC